MIVSITLANVSYLTITYGVLGGFGAGLIYTPGNIICSYHFVKRPNLATGIAHCGSGVGIVLVSLGTNFIVSSHGWKGYFILCACLSPMSVFLAISVYILPEDDEEKTDLEPIRNNEEDEHMKSCR